MANKEDVVKFLADFKQKFKIFDIIFVNRDKNIQALSDLEIFPKDREKYLMGLQVENYFRGPNPDSGNPLAGDAWEFGTRVKENEVYIKIKMGMLNKKVICLSFHIAEFEIRYPFKKSK